MTVLAYCLFGRIEARVVDIAGNYTVDKRQLSRSWVMVESFSLMMIPVVREGQDDEDGKK